MASPAILSIFIVIFPYNSMAKRPLDFLRRFCIVFFLLFWGGVGLRAQVFINPTASTCLKPNGSIQVDATLFPPGSSYSYSINGGAAVNDGPMHTFSLLVGGQTYHIEVTNLTSTGQFITDFTLGDLSPTLQAPNFQPATCLNNDGQLTVNATGGAAPYTYSVNGGSFVSFNLFQGLSSGTATVALKDANGCVANQNVPIPLFNDLVAAAMPIAKPVCEGVGVVLPAASNGDKFTWSPTAGLDNPNILNPTATPSANTTYTLTASRGPGVCPPKTVTVAVAITPAPVPNAGVDETTCYGKSTQLQGSGGVSYLWSPATFLDNPAGQFPNVVNPTTTTTYSLTVTDAIGCVSVKPGKVTVTVTQPFPVHAFPDTTVYAGQPVPLSVITALNIGNLSYEWTPSQGLNNPFIQSPTAVVATPSVRTYVAKVTTPAGCSGTDTITIRALAVADIIVPNAFTPNGDGHNDLLRPITPGIKELKYFVVVNRYGQKVFETTRLGTGWDGSLNGRLLEAGTYVWMASGVDVGGGMVERKGVVILVR